MGKTKKLVELFKKDSVLFISGILAVISCFFVKPDSGYIGYINFRVIAILFSLMLVVSAYIRIGTFAFFTNKLLEKIKSEKNISLFFVILSFFMSMLLTNDVTLVTLVPFAISVLKEFNDRRRTMYTLILMTVSANLGSMLTPIGNPQNLYLYTEYHIGLFDFIKLMLPYSAASLILLVIAVLILNKTDKTLDTAVTEEVSAPKPFLLLIYTALFILCLLTVSNIVNFVIMLAVVAAVMLVFDRKAFINIDYGLLFTFLFFFVLIGNLGRIGFIHDTLSMIIDKNVTLTAVLASQFISNVPAAMLLSAFTAKGPSLLIGTNLGGLGTLIASMASLITYKFYNREKKEGEHYLLAFTLINIVFLFLLLILYYGLGSIQA
ncbi:MAG: citrate transporter [Lachnospiraceae bacterium]|nr:citrate transporter [Lachnospiraceae bacterium]